MLQPEFEVVFAGFGFFKNHVQAQGIEYYPLRTVPFGLGFEAWVNVMEKKKNIYWQVLKDRWTGRLYKLRQAELHEMIRKIRPDHLLIDSWQSTDFIALYPLLKSEKIKIAFIQTMMPTQVEVDIPPLNSLTLPGDAEALKSAQRFLGRQKLSRTLKQQIRYFGRSNSAMVRKKIAVNKIPSAYQSDKHYLFSYCFRNLDEFVLAPEAFDFVSAHRDSFRHYVGFMVDEARVTTADVAYRSAHSRIQEKLSQVDDLIYCSFGSLHYEDLSSVKGFLQRLMEACHERNVVLVIVLHDDDLRNSFRDLPGNIFLFKSVPQLEVLQMASVFITHGGLNSIRESVHKGVPMLVYPTNPDTDHNGNSSRVVFYGLGLRGELARDSTSDIWQKVQQLITDPAFRGAIAKIKGIDQSCGEENFRALIKNIKTLS